LYIFRKTPEKGVILRPRPQRAIQPRGHVENRRVLGQRHIAGKQWGLKRYMNMDRLKEFKREQLAIVEGIAG